MTTRWRPKTRSSCPCNMPSGECEPSSSKDTTRYGESPAPPSVTTTKVILALQNSTPSSRRTRPSIHPCSGVIRGRSTLRRDRRFETVEALAVLCLQHAPPQVGMIRIGTRRGLNWFPLRRNLDRFMLTFGGSRSLLALTRGRLSRSALLLIGLGFVLRVVTVLFRTQELPWMVVISRTCCDESCPAFRSMVGCVMIRFFRLEDRLLGRWYTLLLCIFLALRGSPRLFAVVAGAGHVRCRVGRFRGRPRCGECDCRVRRGVKLLEFARQFV
jgi:hypothetical protein